MVSTSLELFAMEEKAKRSKSERAMRDLNKKRKKRSNLERKRLPYTGLSERTISQRELELVEALVRLSAENILKVLERKDVVNLLSSIAFLEDKKSWYDLTTQDVFFFI